jgi:hypothetical protein
VSTAKDVIWCSHIIRDIQHEENTGGTATLHQGNGIVVCELKFKANYKQAVRVAIELGEKRSQSPKLCCRGVLFAFVARLHPEMCLRCRIHFAPPRAPSTTLTAQFPFINLYDVLLYVVSKQRVTILFILTYARKIERDKLLFCAVAVVEWIYFAVFCRAVVDFFPFLSDAGALRVGRFCCVC